MKDMLKRIQDVGVAVVGDFCIDAYWMIDPSLSEPSLETGKPSRPVVEERYSLGGAGNIVANLAALRTRALHPVAVVGDDPFGREMGRLLESLGAVTTGLIQQDRDWNTPVYGKPYVGEEEQPRFDMGVKNRIHPETGSRVLARLEEVLPRVQAVVVNQQLKGGVLSKEVIRGVNRMAVDYPNKVFIVDSRHESESFEKVIFRFNVHEAARLFGKELSSGALLSLDEARRFARRIEERTNKPVFISLGADGGIVCWEQRVEEIKGIRIEGKTDPVGAGDTSVAALAAALAAGASPLEAAELANVASAVTVQKIKTTGTATPEEILRLVERNVQ